LLLDAVWLLAAMPLCAVVSVALAAAARSALLRGALLVEWVVLWR
jgi:hypothetical protein